MFSLDDVFMFRSEKSLSDRGTCSADSILILRQVVLFKLIKYTPLIRSLRYSTQCISLKYCHIVMYLCEFRLA